ncbi:hypothetical protein BV22DRAFT_1127093 [Leucogyrophana mollusca]|uniref:Uncharacterized protein n=1 Tax=Leucogyrophana mollusca TaxID=85980 RepID=A0ACB8BPE0_9AGAM|nr:hypothetical protein BV22DRAFT_1127093 [Leucogyrophana mollusca]
MVQVITGEELAKIIKSEKIPNKDYLVIDVRDEDWVGGNIKGSRNIPSADFPAIVHELVNETNDIPVVIFHCALSQLRGPKAAKIYEHTRLLASGASEEDTGNTVDYNVFVLQGGFVQFQDQFKDDPSLVENWDSGTWATEWMVENVDDDPEYTEDQGA